MSDVSSHEADHASDRGSHGHFPVDPNDAVVRATSPAPRALLITAVAAALTVLVLVAAAVAAGRGA
jgi:multisubunit Na+/H+ antiporter MnhC subunit